MAEERKRDEIDEEIERRARKTFHKSGRSSSRCSNSSSCAKREIKKIDIEIGEV